jgi:hypothetical protein
MKVPAGKHLLDLVAVDWFKDTKRMDHVARRQGCAAQVSTSPANPSLVLCCSSQTSKLTLVGLFFFLLYGCHIRSLVCFYHAQLQSVLQNIKIYPISGNCGDFSP